METDNRIRAKYKIDYLKLALKIFKLRNQGNKPPKELLQQAYEVGRLSGVTEEELTNL